MPIVHLNDLNATELDIYARLSETELLHYNEPEPGLFIAESPGVIRLAVEAGYIPLSLLVEKERLDKEALPVLECVREHLGEEAASDLPVYTADREVLRRLTGYELVRGLWGAMKRRATQDLDEFCSSRSHIAILYNIVNPTNVGAIIRSAAALGMDGIITTYDTVNPLYRRAARVSMGTVFSIPWTAASKAESDGESLVRLLKESGFTTIAMALKDDAKSVDDPVLKRSAKTAVFLGTEGYGLPDDVTGSCDHTVMIPMHNGVDSLNVAAASAVCFFELMKDSR